MENLTVIPTLPKLIKNKRVAAYARVSSDKDTMLNSLSAQVSFYSKMIQSHRTWIYAGVYADEAISGTKQDRPQFQRMINDCKEGKIDLIVTKSISRFARNTVTLLETVRLLKDINVEVFFEEQNIYTLSADGELLITLLASYAQEEARSVSENMRWRIKKNFEEGKPWGAYLYGYKVIKGEYYINKEEAEVIKIMYDLFLSGWGKERIARELNHRGIKTRLGYEWSEAVVRNILSNYDYTGNLILQKTYRPDYISKKTYKNEGQLPKYHVEDHHEPIIDLETWYKVQDELKKRNDKIQRNAVLPPNPFKGIIKCGTCGKTYQRKITKHRNFWVCNEYVRSGLAGCTSKRLDDGILNEIIEGLRSETDLSLDEFISSIKKIEVYENWTLKVIFHNGNEVIRPFTKHSRKDSWTEEMKELAKQREAERQEKIWQK